MAIDKVTLTGIRVFGYHGVFDHEKKNGQEFIVDVDISYKTNKAIDTDNLKYTIDYAEVALLVKDIIEGESRNLIETVAEESANKIMKKFDIKSVRVTLHKPNAPVDVELRDVSVSVERLK